MGALADIDKIIGRDIDRAERRKLVYTRKAEAFDGRVLPRKPVEFKAGDIRINAYDFAPILGGWQCRVEASQNGKPVPLSNPFRFENAPLCNREGGRLIEAAERMPALLLPHTMRQTRARKWGEGTTHTVFSSTDDASIEATDAAYANVLDGSHASGGTFTGTSTHWIGQRFNGNYTCWESFQDFDTSGIADTDTIDSATLSIYGNNDIAETDFLIYVFDYTWTPAVADADYRTQSAIAALNQCNAGFNTTGYSAAAYNDIAGNAAMLSHINKTGDTTFVLASSRFESGTTPTGNEFVGFHSAEAAGTANDPKLVVESSAAAASGSGSLMMMGMG